MRNRRTAFAWSATMRNERGSGSCSLRYLTRIEREIQANCIFSTDFYDVDGCTCIDILCVKLYRKLQRLRLPEAVMESTVFWGEVHESRIEEKITAEKINI